MQLMRQDKENKRRALFKAVTKKNKKTKADKKVKRQSSKQNIKTK